METQSFLQAIQEGNQDQVRQMLAVNPALVNATTQRGISAVLLAAYYGQAGLAQQLAGLRSDLNIFEACAVGNAARVMALLGDDPTLVNAFAPDGFQPLGLAAFFGHLETICVLLAGGAEVNSPSQNDQRVMPLHSAVASRSLEIALQLLERGADPNARQAGDFTPLHGAAQNGQMEMIELLLAHGAQLNLRSADGLTALGYAEQGSHSQAAALLRKRGAVL
jgi:ankyrin repeat protein